MSLQFFNWSRTASSNASADPAVNWAEGQAPSSVNDSARAMMASLAGYRDDIAGGITTGGTSTAYTVTSYQVFDTLAHLHGQKFAFIPHATNTNAVGVDCTISVDSLGQKPIRMQPGLAIPNGTLILGTPYIASYNNTDGVHYLQNMTNPYNIPLAAGMDFWGTSTPNSSFAFPAGQLLSRTTYASLFSIMGTTYGAGDGSTNFALPDKTGRVSAMKEASGSRLTTAGAGVDGGTIGSAGGVQTITLAQSALPNVAPTFSGAVSSLSQGNILQYGGAFISNLPNTGGLGHGFNNADPSQITPTVIPSGTISSLNGNVTQTAVNNLPPIIVCNYILRII